LKAKLCRAGRSGRAWVKVYENVAGQFRACLRYFSQQQALLSPVTAEAVKLVKSSVKNDEL